MIIVLSIIGLILLVHSIIGYSQLEKINESIQSLRQRDEMVFIPDFCFEDEEESQN
jgi:hypothetical protein